MSDAKIKIREFIVENFLFGDGDELQDSTSLLEEGIIDSQGILELVFFIEDELSIKIDDDELIPENLDSLNNIAVFLSKKTACAA